MARIPPLRDEELPEKSRAVLERHVAEHGSVTNLKRTLAHSPVALRVLLEWYALRDEVVPFLGERLTNLFAHAISSQTDCLICSTFFRRILIDAGENPDVLALDQREAAVVEFGRQLARDPNHVSDELFERLAGYFKPDEIVSLTAFGGLMIATNVFNNAVQVDLDEYLWAYRKPSPVDNKWEQREMSNGLEGRVAFITGAAHGQGRATALALAREGVRIAALDVAKPLAYPGYGLGSQSDLESLAAECAKLGVECLPLAADVRDDGGVSKSVKEAAEKFGRIDILFNNAGICAYGLAHELTEEAWDAMLDINLKGAWLVARRVIPHMMSRRAGVIINNSSIAGLRGMARLSHYAASKWGLVGLTKSWAIELAPFGIRVVSLHPTGVNTPMNDGLAALEGATPQQIAERSAGNLLPVPWIEPCDVTEAVVYLASDRARFVTGSQFVIDAGLLSR